MKKYILITTLSLLSSCLFSQEFYLNISEKHAISKIKEDEGNNVKINKTILKGGKYDISYLGIFAETHVFFTEDGTSYQLCSIPKTNDVLNKVVELFNSKGTRLSDTQWLYFKDGITYSIRLLYVEEIKKYAFYYSIKDN